MALNIKAIGNKINSMGMVSKLGLMEQDMKDNIFKEKSKEKGNLFGLTNLVIKEISQIIISMDMENIFGLMEENLKEHG